MGDLVSPGGPIMTTMTASAFAAAQPFRDHVRFLLTHPVVAGDWRILAALAEVSPASVRRLLFGRQPQIHQLLARALMAIDVDELAAAVTAQVPTAPSRELLAALNKLGYSESDIDTWICPMAHRQASTSSMSRLQAAQVSAGYDYAVEHRICPTVYSRLDYRLAT